MTFLRGQLLLNQVTEVIVAKDTFGGRKDAHEPDRTLISGATGIPCF